MSPNNAAGLHGKLPQYAGFITRRLSMSYTQAWDDWLQRGMEASQRALGSLWLDHYLTSPIWRFVLGTGIVDQQVWAGVMLPSVDRDGGYYPLVIAQPMAPTVLPTLVMVEAQTWFAELEQLALGVLQQNHKLDDVVQSLPRLCPGLIQHNGVHQPWEIGKPAAQFSQHGDINPLHGYPALLHELLRQRYSSYSLWSSAGSERVTPANLVSGYLPSPQCYTSLIAGDWSQRGWSSPFETITPLAFLENTCNNRQEIQNE